MNVGAEMPFRRSAFARKTGSLLLDRAREDHLRDAPSHSEMTIWSQGRFRKV